MYRIELYRVFQACTKIKDSVTASSENKRKDEGDVRKKAIDPTCHKQPPANVSMIIEYETGSGA